MFYKPGVVFHKAVRLCSTNQSREQVAAPGKQFASGSQGLGSDRPVGSSANRFVVSQ